MRGKPSLHPTEVKEYQARDAKIRPNIVELAVWIQGYLLPRYSEEEKPEHKRP